MRIIDLDATSRELMAPVCRACGWWQTTPPAPVLEQSDADESIRLDWESAVESQVGMFGRLLLESGSPVGWMQAAPGRLVPRTRGLPAGSTPPDAFLLTCAYFYDDEYLSGFQTLLHDLVSALKRRDVLALEAYALRDLRPGDRSRGYLSDVNLFNAGVMKGSGFHRVAGSGNVGRYRIDLATLVDAPRHSLAEQRVTLPAAQPS
jgi:hypothetical protein